MFNLLCSCDQWPWTWPDDLHELDLYSLEIYKMCKYALPMSKLSKVIIWRTERQTDTTEIIYHAASWVVINLYIKVPILRF